MRSIANLGIKLSIVGLALLAGVSATLANTLSEVEISAMDSGYGIVLKTDEKTEIKKIVSSDNKMTVQLKDVEVSPDLNTVYNNVANIENVTVAPSGKSDIKIIFKGEGISNSKIMFGDSKAKVSMLKKSQEAIELSAPVSSYTPVYAHNMLPSAEDEQIENSAINEFLSKFNGSSEMIFVAKKYAKKIINKAKSGDINLITVMGAIFVFAALLMRPKKKQSVAEKQQSLSQMLSKPQNGTQISSQMDREIALNRRLADNMPLTRPDGLGAVNSVNAGYGMKAYKNSQRNPYVTESLSASTGVSGIPRRRSLNPQPVKRTSVPVKKQTVLKQPLQSKVQNPISKQRKSMNSATSATPALLKSVPTESTELDSMKFLESITKIYEKNGRTDLAKGLKDNLRKAQMSAVNKNF